jgi:uncharacterized protein (DUF362 family)
MATREPQPNHSGRVYVQRLDPGDLQRSILSALEWLRWEEIILPGSRVFIKPNLTWREHIPGVTVTPAFLRALVRTLKSRTPNISIGEADGGYNGYPVEDAFRGHGLYEMANEERIRLINLTEGPSERVTGVIAGREISARLPSCLLHDVDVFITVPVPKVHAMTYVSLGFKNQWGCIPSPMRLHEHPEFSAKILLINKILHPKLAIFDGTHFLDKTGPMVGQPVPMNLIVASDDVGAGSLACCDIMQLDPMRAKHLALARAEGLLPRSIADVEVSQPLGPLRVHKFRLQRSVVNWVALSAFNSRLITNLLYDSTFADYAHKALYTVRRNRLIARFLYGRSGPPAVEGRRT